LRRAAATCALILLGVACNNSTTTIPTPSVATSARTVPPVGQPMDVVVGSAPTGGPANAMTVRIIDPHGFVVAKAAFTAPPAPHVPDCDSVLQPPVRVGAGAAFYADSKGVVRRLDRSGTVSEVATFKLTSGQQFLSFAVSPDGKHLMASVITVPAKGGQWTEDMERADAGGAAVVLSHGTFATALPTPLVITGWDSGGPTATQNSVICTRESLISREYTGSALVHVGPDGRPLDRIGGSDCVPMDELPNGTVLCRIGLNDCQSLNVRTSSGTTLWRRVPGCGFFEPRLSPDAQAVGVNANFSIIYSRNVSKPASFAREESPNYALVGWAAPGIILAVRQNGELGFASALNPLTFTPLGVNIGGQCIGCVPTGLTLAGLIPPA